MRYNLDFDNRLHENFRRFLVMPQNIILKNYEITESVNAKQEPILILTFDINDHTSSLGWKPVDVSFDKSSLLLRVLDDEKEIHVKTDPISFNDEVFERLKSHNQIVIAGLNKYKEGNVVEYAYLVDSHNIQPQKRHSFK